MVVACELVCSDLGGNPSCSPKLKLCNNETLASNCVLSRPSSLMYDFFHYSLGMCHDSNGNSCPSSGFIMAAEDSDERVTPEWSECSRRYYNGFVG